MSETIVETSVAAGPFAAVWEGARARREPETVRALRAAAWESFRAAGIPGTRLEEWRFTNLAPVAKATFLPARRSAMMPEPTTIARRSAVATASATSRLENSARIARNLQQQLDLPRLQQSSHR